MRREAAMAAFARCSACRHKLYGNRREVLDESDPSFSLNLKIFADDCFAQPLVL
jgi:hypothetical protein